MAESSPGINLGEEVNKILQGTPYQQAEQVLSSLQKLTPPQVARSFSFLMKCATEEQRILCLSKVIHPILFEQYYEHISKQIHLIKQLEEIKTPEEGSGKNGRITDLQKNITKLQQDTIWVEQKNKALWNILKEDGTKELVAIVQKKEEQARGIIQNH